MTPLHWSLEHMFYNHDSLPQLDFLDRQTDSHKEQLDSVWSASMTRDTLAHSPSSAPCQSVLVKNPELQGLSNALLLLPAAFPTKSCRSSPSAFGNASLNATCVCTGWGNEWPCLGWGMFPTWAAQATWRRKSPQLFITNEANLWSGSVVL